MDTEGRLQIGCLGAIVVMLAVSVFGWAVHVITCIKHHEWLLLIAGGVAAPVGVVHGWGVVFGWWPQ